MIRAAIVAESLRAGAVIEAVPLTLRRLERVDAGVGEQPPRWMLVWFGAPTPMRVGLQISCRTRSRFAAPALGR